MWAGEQWTLTRSEVIWKLPATSLKSSLCENLCVCRMLPTARSPTWSSCHVGGATNDFDTSLRPPDAAHSKTAHLE